MKIFNEPLLPGVGFGMGDVTLSDFLETHKLLPEFNHAPIQNFISFQSESAEHLAWKLASNLRQHGLNTEVCLESIRPKKVFNIAEKKDIPFVFFFGEDELRDKTVQIKNLKTKETKTVHSDNINEILEFVKKN